MSTQVEIAAGRLANADIALAVAAEVGLPPAVALALLDMESEGVNFYGADKGGYFAQRPKKLVTSENFAEFWQAVVVDGAKSNGVGPTQITYNGRIVHGKRVGSFFVDAKTQGLDLADPADNMRYGFRKIKAYLTKYPKDLIKVGRLYNGKDSYGITFKRVVGEWERRLSAATEEADVSGWYPKAVKKEIRPGVNDPPIRPIGVILHVDAGNVNSLYDYFNGPSGGIESHLHIQKDGDVEQYRECGFEADANFKANSFFLEGVRRGYISVETQGLAEGEWTPAQLASIKELILWAHKIYGIPLQICAGPKDAGLGFHTLFKDWSNVAGKVCPGPDRKKQFYGELADWMKAQDPRTPPPSVPVTVDLSNVVEAARTDPGAAAGTFTAKADVLLVEKALKTEGLLRKSEPDGHFGTLTISAYAAFQRSAAGGNFSGEDADGIPGLESLTKLGKRHGWSVRP